MIYENAETADCRFIRIPDEVEIDCAFKGRTLMRLMSPAFDYTDVRWFGWDDSYDGWFPYYTPGEVEQYYQKTYIKN